MKRCVKCILPETYKGISFNEEGICNYCINSKKIKYLGKESLLNEINSFLITKKDRNENYDCVIPFSGGQDSTYLLYYFVKVLKLRVVAYWANNGFVPEQTKKNIQKTMEILNVKLITIDNNHLKKCFKYHIESWISKPSPATIGLLCTGCYHPIISGLFRFVEKNNIPIIVWGVTPFEHGSYKYDLLKLNPKSSSHYSYILGYLQQMIKNPRLVINPTCLIEQMKEYFNTYYLKKITENNKKGILFLSPFLKYIRWREDEVSAVLENELKWKKNPDIETKWRGDCNIALLKLWLYKELIGYNDKEPGLSSLIRDGQINREEALRRLKEECEVPDMIVRKVLDENGIDFQKMKDAINKEKNIYDNYENY